MITLATVSAISMLALNSTLTFADEINPDQNNAPAINAPTNDGNTLERYGDPGTKTEVVLDEAHFPDANFRKYLSDELNITEGDIITETDLNSVTEIYLNKSNVSSLKGIEYFKKLTDLYYYKNSLSSLDISMNTDLTTGSQRFLFPVFSVPRISS